MCNANCSSSSEREKGRKPNSFISSLISKRRNNRRSECPSIFLDAVLTNSIVKVKRHRSVLKLKRSLQKKRQAEGIAKTSSNCTQDSGTVDSFNDDFDRLSGLDEFFEKLNHHNSSKNVEINFQSNTLEQEVSKSQFRLSDDDVIQTVVDNFIETVIT